MLLHARAMLTRALPSGHERLDHDHVELLRSCGRRPFGKLFIVLTSIAALAAFVCGGVWWMLASGPIALDIATPWLRAALEEKLGRGHQVEVGGTVLERDEDGRTALRLTDIVVRNAQGAIVASAPKAEVGVTGASLLMGHPRAERLSLIGAEMAVRIERDGQLTVFAGAGESRLATSVPGARLDPPQTAAIPPAPAPEDRAKSTPEPNLLAATVGWLQSLDAVGLDGGDLAEIGLKNGSIVVDDHRTGKQLRFDNINLSLLRPKEGGASLVVNSIGADGPWMLNATVTPRGDGNRLIDATIRDVSPKDILLALRLGDGSFQADAPVSGTLRAEIGPDGVPQMLQGYIAAGAGYVGDPHNAAARVLIDEFQARLQWDAANRILHVPIELHSGPNRITLLAQVDPPRETGGRWAFAISQGQMSLASSERPQDPPVLLDQVKLRAVLDVAKRRLDVEQVNLGGAGGGMAANAILDFSGAEPWLSFGISGTRMGASDFKRMWPALVQPEVRNWIDRNVLAGSVEGMVVQGSAPVAALIPGGPPLAPDALRIEIVSKGTVIRPIDGLPPIRDVDLLTTRINGRTASITVGRGTVELPSGRRLTVTNGAFEVPDTHAKPAQSRTRFRIEGPLDAAAELLTMEPLRDTATIPVDPAGTRGTVGADVTVGVPLMKGVSTSTVTYGVQAKLANLSIERFVRGHKAEASVLNVKGTQDGVLIEGDMRIAGVPASVNYQRSRHSPDANIRIQATVDDVARGQLGWELGGVLSGPVLVKLTGTMKPVEREGQFKVEADLTQARVTELVPGWTKPAGRPSRAVFTLVDKGQTVRLEEFSLQGSGANIRNGTLEIDSEGELLSANFPVFALSDGDKATLRAERGNDGVLRVTMRGDVYDGRGLVRGAVSGQKPNQRPSQVPDLELDIKIGAMPGHHGETLRSLDLRMSRRGGEIRVFSMNGKIGRNAPISGDLRVLDRGSAPKMILTAGDAGALFRFTDIYPRIYEGTAEIRMDPPRFDDAPREGEMVIRSFAVRGEKALEQVAAQGGNHPNDPYAQRRPVDSMGVSFNGMAVKFTHLPGRFSIRDGIVVGPSVGGTVDDGVIDYKANSVRMRGTFVPAYALNNVLARIPLLGPLVGGSENEGVFGVTFLVTGTPGAPVLQVNPLSPLMPGIARKILGGIGMAGGERTGPVPPESIRER